MNLLLTKIQNSISLAKGIVYPRFFRPERFGAIKPTFRPGGAFRDTELGPPGRCLLPPP